MEKSSLIRLLAYAIHNLLWACRMSQPLANAGIKRFVDLLQEKNTLALKPSDFRPISVVRLHSSY